MKKFLVLYMAPSAAMAEMMKNSTPEQRNAGMEKWNTWMEAHKGDMVDGGAPVGKNMRVTKEGATPVSNDVGGYSIIQAESIEDAATIVATSPDGGMKESYVEVMEIVQM